MNIGPMLRALLGETSPAEGSRALELRIGQIVRGVLMEILDNGEALVNINGAHVRAKLEAEMPPGRSTLLQVQPGSTGGTIMLKTLADTSEALPDEGLKNVLKSFGFPDQKWSYELLRGLKSDGYSIGKETASFFRAAAALKPSGTDSASWMAAANVAYRRGLAATEDTLTSLRQALFGRSVTEELAGFSAALQEWQGSGTPKSPQVSALAGRLQALLAEGNKLIIQGEAEWMAIPAAAAGNVADKTGAARVSATSTLSVTDTETTSAATPASPGGQAADAAQINKQGQLAVPGGNRPPSPASSAGLPEEAASPNPLLSQTDGKPTSSSVSAQRPPDAFSTSASRSTVQTDTAMHLPALTANAADSRGETPWLGRFLQWLGAGHENRLLHGDARLLADAATAGMLQTGDPTTGEAARSAPDSLKSALLTLAFNEEAPPALRDAAQTLVNQITGQQLLLSSERQMNAPFSLMTLFVPMKNQDGETTATVHVQTRRGRRGEWDSDNCRLFFDLKMRHLGDTFVDVSVVDRIVSIKLMNDFPGMADMVEQNREELGAGLRGAGFQLLSMTALPLPVLKESAPVDPAERADKTEPQLSSAYSAKPYKGVDFRV